VSDNCPKESDSIIIGEVQLLLAEKRTSLAAMRTGIAVFALPLSVLSVLTATSEYYDILQVMHWLLPLLAISLGLVVLGTYLTIRSILRIRNYDRIILDLKRKHSRIAEFIDAA
jgi:uncharacterized membrane protein YidH (DUF202 family)